MEKNMKIITDIINACLGDILEKILKKAKDKKSKCKFEKTVLTSIKNKIKEIFESDKVKDWLIREQYNFNQNALLYNDANKKQFIQCFFETHKDLKYLYTKEIESVIYEYMDNVNNIVDEVLSPEGKILMNTIRNETKHNSEQIIQHMQRDAKEIKQHLHEIKNAFDKSQQKETPQVEKQCIGYGTKNGRCDNVISKDDTEYCDVCLKAEYRDKIVNLYKIQKYIILKEEKFFVAKQSLGIVQIQGIVFPLYSNTPNISEVDLYRVLDEMNQIPDLNKYHFIHIVSNGIVKSKHQKIVGNQNASIYTEESIINQIMDFSTYLQQTITDYTESELFNHYIELYDENTDEPLEYTISDFINDNTSDAIFILGDYGCGKTSFLMNLAYRLSKEYIEGKSEYIPLFIALKEYSKAVSFDNLFMNFFISKCNILNPSLEAFRLLLKYQKFIILFDGFDEVAKRVNYDVKFEMFNEICKFGINDTKLIVTCRPNYFQEKQEYKKLIKNSYLHLEPNSNSVDFEETYIKDLNEHQISDYIASYTNNTKIPATDIEYFIKKTHDLMDLAKRPFLLNMIVQTLPQLIEELKGKKDISEFKINAAKLYDHYVNSWLDRENLKGKTLIRKEDKLHFCKHIAFKMFIDDNYYLHFSMFPDEIRNYFQGLSSFDDIDYFSHDIQSCSFMNTDGLGNFKFIHKSFMEYFVAIIICEKLQQASTIDIPFLNETLAIRGISSEIALFINDILNSNQITKEEIFSALEDNVEKVNDIVRENIITILTKTKYNIANVIEDDKEYIFHDFSHAIIKNKTISNVDFSNATFYNATIENVKFIDCNFEQTYFQKATLKHVDFSRQNLISADLSYCKIENCRFIYSVLMDAQISQSRIMHNDFEGCDMSGIITNDSLFENNYYEDAIGIPYEMM